MCFSHHFDPETGYPRPGANFKHHSGRTYVILHITNIEATDPEKFPIEVVYRNIHNGTVWSRPLDKWMPKFSPANGF